MGSDEQGTLLSYEEAKKYIGYVRDQGLQQFFRVWDETKERHGDDLKWGDEIEGVLVSLNHDKKTARLLLRQTETLKTLGDAVERQDAPFSFHVEGTRYVIESTPGGPYINTPEDLLSAEKNMKLRRAFQRRYLKANEMLMTLSSFPRLGAAGLFTEPAETGAGCGLFLPDTVMSEHARYQSFNANLQSRRGGRPFLNVPVFFDEHTPRPFRDGMVPTDCIPSRHSEENDGTSLEDHIFLDSMPFGSGCCALQVTLQAYNMAHARRLYDALAPIAPIMMAMTAASPVWRGWLSDVDCRWNVVCSLCDDRTAGERGTKPLKEGEFLVPKTRSAGVNFYIADDQRMKREYNDAPAPFDEPAFKRLCSHGVDELLSKHIAYSWIRDPLVLYPEMLEKQDQDSRNHFDNISSTNWFTVKLKFPESPKLGWRVEFRPMEVQPTDFENAAFCVFIVLLSRAVLKFGLNLYVPISKVDDNIARAQRRDAAKQEKFWFRREVGDQTTNGGAGNGRRDNILENTFPVVETASGQTSIPVEDEYEEMTIDEIMNGKNEVSPGLIGWVQMYLDTLELSDPVRARLLNYLDLLRGRANGSLLTPASWMRKVIRSHPAYKRDTVVTEEINYDLLIAIDQM